MRQHRNIPPHHVTAFVVLAIVLQVAFLSFLPGTPDIHGAAAVLLPAAMIMSGGSIIMPALIGGVLLDILGNVVPLGIETVSLFIGIGVIFGARFLLHIDPFSIVGSTTILVGLVGLMVARRLLGAATTFSFEQFILTAIASGGMVVLFRRYVI